MTHNPKTNERRSIVLSIEKRKLVRQVSVSICLTLLMLCGGANRATAELLYSLDRTADELVVFNTASGTISVVGPIGFNMRETRLAFQNGILYGLTGSVDGGFNLGPYRLVGMNPLTGQMVSNVNVTLNGQNLNFSEGLASVGGQLVIGYRTPGVGSASDSQTLGNLSLSGVITNADIFSAFDADFDGLAAGSPGQLFSVDGVVGQSRFDVYTVDRSPAPLAYDPFGSYSGGTLSSPFNSHDLAFTTAGLFVLNTERNEIHLINTTTRALDMTVAYPDSIVLTGLEPAPNPESVPTPEPSAFVLAALGLAGLGLIAWRRRRQA